MPERINEIKKDLIDLCKKHSIEIEINAEDPEVCCSIDVLDENTRETLFSFSFADKDQGIQD